MAELKSIFGIVLGALSVTTNLLLIIVLLRTQAGWQRLNLQMVVPIALTDLLISVMLVTTNSFSLAMGEEELLSSTWFCTYFGTSLLILPMVAMVLISVMALDRYCLIVYSNGISRLWGWLLVMILNGTIAAVLITNTAMNGLYSDPKRKYCHPNGDNLLTIIGRRLCTFVIIAGLMLVTFCYVGIYVYCRKTLFSKYVMSYRYLGILLAYQICWLPKFITSVWGLFSSNIPKPLSRLGLLGLVLLRLVNPCLIFAFQYSLRKELSQLFFRAPKPSEDLIKFTQENYRKSTFPYPTPA